MYPCVPLPISLKFDTFVGPYLADGEIWVHTISLFDPGLGFVTDRVSSVTISIDVSLKPDPERKTVGQPFDAHLLILTEDRLRTEIETDEQAAPRTEPLMKSGPRAR